MTAAAPSLAAPPPRALDPAALRTAGLTAAVMGAFAANSLLCRAALEGGLADAASFTALRLASGAVVLGLVARRRGGSAPARDPASAVVLFAYATLFSVAYLRVSTGAGALLLFAAVQATMIGAGLRGGERPAPREWAGLVLALCGLLLLARPGTERPDAAGAALMLGAGVAWGVYSLRGRGARDPVAANAASFAGAVPLAFVVLALARAADEVRLTQEGALLALLSGGVASGLFYAAWYAALRSLSATRAALVQLAVPPLAASGGVVFLGESLGVRLVVSGALVLGGIALAVIGSAGRRTAAAPDVGTSRKEGRRG